MKNIAYRFQADDGARDGLQGYLLSQCLSYPLVLPHRASDSESGPLLYGKRAL